MNQKFGLALMVIGTSFGIWSAVNPSYFTIRKFGVSEEDRKLVIQGFAIGALIIFLLVLGVWMVFR